MGPGASVPLSVASRKKVELHAPDNTQAVWTEEGRGSQWGCQALWLVPAIPGFGRPRQEDCEFKSNLGYKISSRMA